MLLQSKMMRLKITTKADKIKYLHFRVDLKREQAIQLRFLAHPRMPTVMGKFRVVSYASSGSLGVCSFCCILVCDSYMAYLKYVHACASFYHWNLRTCDRSQEIRMETVSRLRISKTTSTINKSVRAR